ncbi:ABC transporter permease [Kibdelosporangium persicum]|uniref:ABC-type antimicrobial peptide transport system, permease component n=1 Tax=Kibdelosporangium persicum TaxID=2698649 RepID=A0ABX2FEU8_9PSEU|nr:ABC transporter permease [Kibdelosporangium persicum]NRN69817.1 ABC-type antimicrobial peptide transport system, permease component [Kibdelosporangium persicum]
MTVLLDRAPDAEPLPSPRRLGSRDMLRLGAHGMRTRPLRAVLSALGIAIGIAAMIAVVSIPASSNKALADQIAALGPNLLVAKPGRTFFGEDAKLPRSAVGMVHRIGPVTGASSTGTVKATVRRNDQVNPDETSGLAVFAARPDLLGVLNGTIHSGKFLDAASARFPAVVLGSVAATRLGIDRVDPAKPPQVWIAGQWFTVTGILNAMPLAPEIERSVLVGWEVAEERLGFDGHPTTVYTRAQDAQVEDVRGVLAATVNPEHPNEVEVSLPSEALAAQELVDQSYSALFLALGGVALLVGGVGVANTMVISVLERRREIGLRRALGATRRQIRGQFLAESVLLSGLGGIVGVVIGVGVTAGYALSQNWPAVLPPLALVGGVGISALVGAIAGAYPAMRAARLTPTSALA